MNRTRTLAILLFDDVEVLDFCGPFEVFSVGNGFTDPPAFSVLTVAEKPGPVLTRGGLSVNPHHRLLGRMLRHRGRRCAAPAFCSSTIRGSAVSGSLIGAAATCRRA